MNVHRTELANIWVSGEVKAQPRPKARAMARRHGKVVQVRGKSQMVDSVVAGVYTPVSAEKWKAAVRSAWTASRVGEAKGPISVFVTLYVHRPKRLKGSGAEPHPVRPDIDNLAKAIMDALGDAGAWHDDAQVWELRAQKLYAAKDGPEGARIRLYESRVDDQPVLEASDEVETRR